MIVVSAFDLYISNREKHLDVHDKKMNIGELIFLGLIAALLIVFIFLWIFYHPEAPPKINPNNPDLIFSKYSKRLEGFEDPDFKIVDLNKVYNNKVPSQVYTEQPVITSDDFNKMEKSLNKMVFKSTDSILKLKMNEDKCVIKENCGFRIGILTMNAKIIDKNTSLKGIETARPLFFPGDTNINNDFLLIFGK